jgi:hypothetical protein
MPITRLRAADGATLYGSVTDTGGGRFRAAFYAAILDRPPYISESPEYRMFNTRDEGVAWIDRQAAALGFAAWFYERSGS